MRGPAILTPESAAMTFARSLITLAIIEAGTLLALVGIAVPVKYLLGLPVLVTIIGPVHGAVFVLFIVATLIAWIRGMIDVLGVLRLGIGAMIPFGGLVNERWLRRELTRP